MKKRLKLGSGVKWLILGFALLGLLKIVEESDRDFVKKCMSAGYSKNYCIAHK